MASDKSYRPSNGMNETTPCSKKNSQNCFCHNYVKFSPILVIFLHDDGQDDGIVRCTHFPFHLIYVKIVNETQMLQFCITLSCCLQ